MSVCPAPRRVARLVTFCAVPLLGDRSAAALRLGVLGWGGARLFGGMVTACDVAGRDLFLASQSSAQRAHWPQKAARADSIKTRCKMVSAAFALSPPPRSLTCARPRQSGEVESSLMELLKQGGYFFKHDYGRSKRGRKWLVLSTDGLSLRWRSVGAHEVVPAGDGSSTSRGGSSARATGFHS